MFAIPTKYFFVKVNTLVLQVLYFLKLVPEALKMFFYVNQIVRLAFMGMNTTHIYYLALFSCVVY